jgi:hypothetical protein
MGQSSGGFAARSDAIPIPPVGSRFSRLRDATELRLARYRRGAPGEKIMPALLPVILTAAHLALTAHAVPKLNVAPSCQAAAEASIRRPAASVNICMQDERRARAKLQRQWNTYSRAERVHCRRLTTLGGPPSYVELLTCLQMASDAEKLPDNGGMKRRVEQ